MAGFFSRLEDDEEQQVVIRSERRNMEAGCAGKQSTRCYIGIIIILSVVVIVLSIAIAVIKVRVLQGVTPSAAEHGDDSVCRSKQCYLMSADIMSRMNMSADPCQNFYEYACGGFIANTFMNPSDVAITPPGQIAQATGETLYQGTVCTTDQCRIVAGEIIALMNRSAEPCNDFYNYACGNYEQHNFLRPAEAKISQFSHLTEENSKVVFQTLTADKVTLFGKNSSSLVKVKKLTKLCMNVTALQKDGHRPLRKAMDKFGTWAMTDDEFKVDTWNFTDQMLQLHLYGLSPLMSVFVEPDEKNSSVNILNLFQSGLTLSSEKDYNLTEPVNQRKRDAFIEYGIEVARLMGTERHVARPVMEEIYELEMKLAEIYVPSKVVRNPSISYSKVSLADVKAMFDPHLDIAQFLSAVLNRTDIGNDNHLVMSSRPYMESLGEVLAEYLNTTEKKRVMNNYLSWYLIHRAMDYLGSDFQFAQLILKSVTDGINSLDERWKVCTGKVVSMMGRATGAAFIEGRFRPEDKKTVTDIVMRVRDSLIENFPGYKWMDEETAKAAEKKAKAIVTNIGYPEYITSAKQVDEYYKDLNVADTFLDSVLEYRLWEWKLTMEKLNKPPDAKEWQMTASEVNAYYNPVYNQVVLPAGILRKPFYDMSLPMSWNYGGMGSVVGHEMSHGFDDRGSQYNYKGNLRNWWTDHSKKGFDTAKKCFVDQYAKYKLQGTPLNSELNLGENIADNGGVAISYRAYLQMLEDTERKSYQLPGLNLTDDQLFFLSFAQIWCSKSTPEYDQSSFNFNAHSPGRFRVQGTYSNSRAFSEAFNCKTGSPYNPPNKCKIW